jgi:hypothetical protein
MAQVPGEIAADFESDAEGGEQLGAAVAEWARRMGAVD